ncbi:MAG TPA: hypothetical protein VEK79_05310 [Thermoanaerobaculia bacterium]|nr:hypothetical protein [Thermoanaerobaculia bacterium]
MHCTRGVRIAGTTACEARTGTSVAASRNMLRRLVALAGFVTVLLLALLLLYRVYLHHTAAEPYVDDEPSIVSADVNFASGIS